MGIVNVYASLIKKGLKTLDDVPMHLKKYVKAELDLTNDSKEYDVLEENNEK